MPEDALLFPRPPSLGLGTNLSHDQNGGYLRAQGNTGPASHDSARVESELVAPHKSPPSPLGLPYETAVRHFSDRGRSMLAWRFLRVVHHGGTGRTQQGLPIPSTVLNRVASKLLSGLQQQVPLSDNTLAVIPVCAIFVCEGPQSPKTTRLTFEVDVV